MRSETGRLLRGRGSELQHRCGVSGGFGMVREPREVRAAHRRRAQLAQRRSVEFQPAMRVDRSFDGEPRQLVPEHDSIVLEPKHPGGEALAERGDGIPGDRLQQPQFRTRRRHGHRIEEIPRPRVESSHSREDRVAHAARDLRGRGRENLSDEERVPARAPVQLFGIDRVARGQQPHRRRRERGNRDAHYLARGRKLSEDGP